MSRIRFKYLFHGTSSIFRRRIEKEGLLPRNGALHLTTNPEIAWEEADRTVRGEDPQYGYKRAVGGEPLIVKVDREAVSGLRIDSPGWYDKDSKKHLRLVAKRFSFRTERPVRPISLSFIDSDMEIHVPQLLDEINGMATWRSPFECRPDVEAEIRAALERRRSSQ